METQIKVLLLSFGITVILSLFIIPILKKLKVGQIEREEGLKSHLKKQGTPTMGGIIMMVAITIVSVLMFVYYRTREFEVAKNLIPLVTVLLGFGIIGFLDDFRKLKFKNTDGLKPAVKMLGLLIISAAFVVYITKVLNIGTDIFIPIAKTYFTLPLWIYIPFAIFILLGTTNAINLTDGVDGLATSITTIVVTCLTMISLMLGDFKEITIIGSLIIGTCLGFLLFNLKPAKVMMGDTGSLMLGGAIASIALYLKLPLLLIIICIIPIIETFSVMIQVFHYKRTGNRVFKMAPIHHHFELSGWNENKVVSVFSIITLIACIVGINII
ncbi:MAG: phospho-N-acetylmuramoyl-pentapeptide-transferase [Clostridia bacterium]|nr:phospho-N-acetylmuramoyl-pentapeptide-transferase [Clostridia bacterium]